MILGLGLGFSSGGIAPVNDLFAAFAYDSIGNRTVLEATQFNAEANNHFDSSTTFDISNGGAYLTKSTAFAVDGGTPTNFVIDDDAAPVFSSQMAGYIAAISEGNRALINTIIVAGGTNDGKDTAITKSHFKTYMGHFYTLLKEDFPALQKVIWYPLHRRESGTQDAAYQNIKEAIYEQCAESANFVLGPEIYDTDQADTVHPTTAQFEDVVAPRAAQRAASAYGKLTSGATGPQITSASYDSNVVTATITHDLGDRLELKPNATNVVKNAAAGEETITGYNFNAFSWVAEIEDAGVPASNSRFFLHRIDAQNYISILWFSNGNMQVQVEVSNALQTAVYNASSDFTDSGDKKRLGFSINGSGDILLYIDGVEKLNQTLHSQSATVTNHYRLSTNSGAQAYTAGAVYDYSIYDNVLTATELAAYTGNTFTSMGDFFALDDNGTIKTPTAITQSGNELSLTFSSVTSADAFYAGYGTMSGLSQADPSVLRDNAVINLPLRQGVWTF